ncbi:MAG: hypothetical protein HYZ45_08265 [Burkholderiales bacterium]|nr:hypothetical protein [Burkholderiales bacterium]
MPGCGIDAELEHVVEKIAPWLGSDPLGGLWWRQRDGTLHEIHMAAQADAPATVCEVPQAAVLHDAERIVFGRSWLYSARGNQIARHDAASLQPDAEFTFDGTVLDIASDADDGLMVLLRHDTPPPVAFSLQRLCASGKLLPPRPLPAALHPSRLTYLAHTACTVALSADGAQIGFIDAEGNCDIRALASLLSADGNFCAKWIESDRLDRFVLLGKDGGGRTQCVVCDARGDVIASVNADGAHAAVIAGDMLYWLSDAALLRLAQATNGGDASADGAGGSGGVHGQYLTPLMQSPRKASESGWLRAHIEAMLPAGATMHVTVLRCDDDEAAAASRDIAVDQSLTPAQRITALTTLQGWRSAATYDFGGSQQDSSATKAQIYDIPLFDDDAPWCRLLLELAAAPLSDLPRLESCTVLYPNISLMQYLPAMFKGGGVAENRPGGDDPFLRTLVGVWESQTQGLDRAISQSGARVHPDTAPAVWLDFLARKLGCPWHNSLPEAAKRRILQAADALAQARGTRYSLALLLQALLPDIRYEVIDVAVDYGLATLGGIGRHGVVAGSSLPTLLSGLPPDAARLSRKAVLGVMRLGGSDGSSGPASDAYQRFLGQIKIILHTVRNPLLADVLPSLLTSIVPAGVVACIEWHAEPRAWQLDSGLQLDDPSPGRLNQSLRLNRSTLSGKRKRQLPTGGLLPGFHLS